MKKAWIAGLVLLFVGFTGCTQKEMDDLAKGQQCLDQVSDSNPQSATDCLQYATPYDSQRANVLKCSIYLTAGGITTARVAQAYTASQDNSISSDLKQAMYISFLALNYPDATGGYTLAQTAQSYCEKSGEAGLIFESSMAVIGSLTNKLAGGLDFTQTPADINTAVQNALDTCQSSPSSCDPNVIAPVAVTAATTYCASATANADVCADVNQAVSSWGNDNNTLTQGLMCLLQGKTFTPPSTCS